MKIFCSLLLAFFTASCFAQDGYVPYPILVKDNIACLYGYKDSLKNWIITPQYEFADHFIRDNAIAAKNGKYGVIDTGGKILIPFQYEEVSRIYRDFSGSYMPDEDDDWYRIIDEVSYTIPGIFRIKQNGKYGIIRIDNTMLVQPTYKEIEDFENGFAIIRTDSLEGYVGINWKIITPAFSICDRFMAHGFAIVLNGKKRGIIDSTGKLLLPVIYDWISVNGGNVYEYVNPRPVYLLQLNDKYGLARSEGIILPVIYDTIEWRPHDNVLAMAKDNLWGLFNLEDDLLTKPYLDTICRISGAFVYKQNGRYGLLNLKGEKVGKAELDAPPADIDGTYLVFKKKGKYGLYTNPGQEILKPIFDRYLFGGHHLYFILGDSLVVFSIKSHKIGQLKDELYFTGGIAAFAGYLENQQGIVDSLGRIIVQPDVKIACWDNPDYMTFVTKKNELGIVLSDGSLPVAPGKYFNRDTCNEAGYFVVGTAGGRTGIIDLYGNLLVDTLYAKISNYSLEDSTYWVAKAEDTLSSSPCGYKFGLIDKHNNYILPPEYDFPVAWEIEWRDSYISSFTILSKGGLYGVQAKEGEILIPFEYDAIGMLNNGYYLLFKNGKFGFADDSIIAPPRFDFLNDFSNGYAYFRLGAQEGIINERGEYVVGPEINALMKSKENLYALDFFVYDRNGYEGNSIWYFEITESDSISEEIRSRVNNVLLSLAVSDIFTEYYSVGTFPDPCPEVSDEYYESNGRDVYYYSIEVVNEQSVSISKRIEYQYRDTRYESYLSTYSLAKDTTYQITLESLFLQVNGLYQILNEKIVSKIRGRDDIELDCTNPEKYFEHYKDKFVITKHGILIYLMEEDDYYDDATAPYITLSYSELDAIADKNGVLAEFYR